MLSSQRDPKRVLAVPLEQVPQEKLSELLLATRQGNGRGQGRPEALVLVQGPVSSHPGC